MLIIPQYLTQNPSADRFHAVTHYTRSDIYVPDEVRGRDYVNHDLNLAVVAESKTIL